MRQVADNQTVGDAAVLVHHEEIRHVVSATRVHQLAELVAAAVQPLRAREDEAHFLTKKEEFLSMFRIQSAKDRLGPNSIGSTLFQIQDLNL